MMTVVERIDAMLESRKMSRRQLAKKAKIPASTLQSAMERGKNISFDMLTSIAKALDVRVSELMPDDLDGAYHEGFKRGEELRQIILRDEEIRMGPYWSRAKAAMEKLNDAGQAAAAERVEELTEIPKYQRQGMPTEAPQDPPEDKK